MYKGGKKRNTANSLPLRIVEISFFQLNEHSLASINTIQASFSQTNLYSSPVKTSILFFMGEFLNQLLSKIQYTEAHLFEEIKQELIWLNETEELANYPIFWLIQWIDKLGIKPLSSEGNYFDIEAAQFSQKELNSVLFVYGEEMRQLANLFQEDRITILSYPLTKASRKVILNALISYCTFHIPEFKQFKSIEVLQTVFN
jgi:DNA repair protein RecO (recombination protein O)